MLCNQQTDRNLMRGSRIMILKFNQYIINIDVERTRAFYEGSSAITTSQQCTCSGCQNFDKAILTVPDSIHGFFQKLGINPSKPSDAFGVTGERDDDGRYWYNGWYHIAGTLIRPVIPERSIDYAYVPDGEYDFKVWFISDNESTGFIEADFPKLNVEIWFDTHLPWVI